MKAKKLENSITMWTARMLVRHHITDRVGEVVGLDFEEDLAEVRWAEFDSWCRMENLRAVGGDPV